MSTSSSDPPATGFRIPWAFLLALVLLGAFELALRAAVPVEEFPTRMELRKTAALRHVLDHEGAAEIAFMGASVARRAITVPEVQKYCREFLGREIRVANYAHPGLKAELGEDVVHVLLREDPPPRLILYGMTLHQIRSDAGELTKTSWVWTLPDLRRKWEERGFSVVSEIPQVLRNELRRHYRTFQVRYVLESFYDRIVHDQPFPPSAMQGQRHHLPLAAGLNLEEIDWEELPDWENLQAKIAACTVDGRFTFSEQRIQSLIRAQELCERHGVRLVFFECPLPRPHLDLLPPGAMEEFYAIMGRLQRDHGLTFRPLTSLSPRWTLIEFADQSHLNIRGARRFSKVLFNHVLQRELRALGDQ